MMPRTAGRASRAALTSAASLLRKKQSVKRISFRYETSGSTVAVSAGSNTGMTDHASESSATGRDRNSLPPVSVMFSLLLMRRMTAAGLISPLMTASSSVPLSTRRTSATSPTLPVRGCAIET